MAYGGTEVIYSIASSLEPTVAPGHCSLCDGLFRNPRRLPCGHNFCDPCIRANTAAYPRWMKAEGVFDCPTCDEKYQLPKEGVDGLPENQDVQSVQYTRGDEYCQKHDQVQSWHCEECNRTMCPTCFDEDHRDQGHVLSLHKSGVVKKKTEIKSALRDVTPKVDKINQYIKKLELTDDQVARDAAIQNEDIDETVNTLIEHLRNEAESLKRRVGETADSERKQISTSVAGLKKIVDDFKELGIKANQLYKQGTNDDVEADADDLLAQINKDWCPSVPVNLLRKTWKSTVVDLKSLEYGSPKLGTVRDVEHKVKFHFDILSYSGASVTAVESHNFNSGFEKWDRTQFCTTDGGYIFMSGKTENFWKICQFDLSGNQIWATDTVKLDDKKIPKPCGIQVINLASKQFLAASSASQHTIQFYDTSSKKSMASKVYHDREMCLNQMCILSPSTLIALCAEQNENKNRKVLYLRQRLTSGSVMMQKTFTFETHMAETYGICVVSTNLTPRGQLVILTSWKKGSIRAFELNGNQVWKVSGVIGGLDCSPHGVCADRRGHVYLADGKNKRVIVLNAEDGSFIQTLVTNDQHGIGLVYSVGWSEMRDQRFLIVNHQSEGHQQITTFKIGYQVKVDT